MKVFTPNQSKTKAILRYLRTNGPTSATRVANAMDLDREEALAILRRLVSHQKAIRLCGHGQRYAVL